MMRPRDRGVNVLGTGLGVNDLADSISSGAGLDAHHGS